MRRRRTAWFLVSLWMALIAWGSLAPGAGVAAVPDALVHSWAYLVLAWLLRGAIARNGWSTSPLIPGILAWGFGALMEAMQLTVPLRSAEARDLAANGIGVLIGIMLPILPPGRTDTTRA
jgi:VanZ family protein